MSEYHALIDVRTPAEFDSGHLEGALLLNIYDPEFLHQLDALDKGKNYLVYCRSGSRSSQAVEIMLELGFMGEVVNGGSLSDASGLTGAQIVIDEN